MGCFELLWQLSVVAQMLKSRDIILEQAHIIAKIFLKVVM